jgi:hypothetical protein
LGNAQRARQSLEDVLGFEVAASVSNSAHARPEERRPIR